MTARIAGKYTRSQLRMLAPRSRSLAIDPGRGGSTLHWGGAGSRIVDHRSCIAIWRGWQEFHMGPSRGWVDIAYTMGFCQHGWVFPGRGYGVRTAAQGTTRGNDISYAFCHINEAGKPPTAAAVDAATWLVADARRAGKAGPGLWPHNFWHEDTECPGDQWRARIRSLGRANAPAPAPKGEDMPSEQEIVTALLDTHMPVKDLGSDGKPLTLRYLLSRIYQSATRNEAAVVELTHQVADLRDQVARLLAAGEGS